MTVAATSTLQEHLSTASSYRYRADVDGLRAIAIVPVVAFHAGLPGVDGGFVGVDVFFVISGFLISGMLLDELRRTDRIDLPRFYARRARRLFPALALVCLVTLALGAMLLLPFGEQQELAQSSIATSFFASNVFFWMKSGYFDAPAEQRPLLNMWTLSVEEQFYWVWPLLLFAVWQGTRLATRASRLRTASIATVCVLIFAMSLASCIWLTSHAPLTAFYMMPVRGWEFALGALVALAPHTEDSSANVTIRSILGVAGVAMIVASIMTFSRATPFPGIAAALPAVGTALVIYSGSSSSSVAPRLLALPPLVMIGQLSYSWYLWHWPLIAIARAYAFGTHDVMRDTLLAVVALLLAWITYRFVENPIRRASRGLFSTTRGALAGGAALLLAIAGVALGLGLHAKSITPASGRYGELLAAIEDWKDMTPECKSDYSMTRFPDVLSPVEKCSVGERRSAPRVMLWGDSFAHQYVPLLDYLGKKDGFKVVQRVLYGCAPLLDIVQLDPSGALRQDCVKFNPLVKAELSALRGMGVDSIVLAANWTVNFPPPGSPGLKPQQAVANLEAGLQRTLDELYRNGFKVLLIAPSPRFPIPVPQCLARKPADDCGISRTILEEDREHIMRVMRTAHEQSPTVRIFDPLPALCNPHTCPAVIDNVIGYRDRSHIAARVLPALEASMEAEVNWLLAPEDLSAATTTRPTPPQGTAKRP